MVYCMARGLLFTSKPQSCALPTRMEYLVVTPGDRAFEPKICKTSDEHKVSNVNVNVNVNYGKIIAVNANVLQL